MLPITKGANKRITHHLKCIAPKDLPSVTIFIWLRFWIFVCTGTNIVLIYLSSSYMNDSKYNWLMLNVSMGWSISNDTYYTIRCEIFDMSINKNSNMIFGKESQLFYHFNILNKNKENITCNCASTTPND